MRKCGSLPDFLSVQPGRKLTEIGYVRTMVEAFEKIIDNTNQGRDKPKRNITYKTDNSFVERMSAKRRNSYRSALESEWPARNSGSELKIVRCGDGDVEKQSRFYVDISGDLYCERVITGGVTTGEKCEGIAQKESSSCKRPNTSHDSPSCVVQKMLETNFDTPETDVLENVPEPPRSNPNKYVEHRRQHIQQKIQNDLNREVNKRIKNRAEKTIDAKTKPNRTENQIDDSSRLNLNLPSMTLDPERVLQFFDKITSLDNKNKLAVTNRLDNKPVQTLDSKINHEKSLPAKGQNEKIRKVNPIKQQNITIDRVDKRMKNHVEGKLKKTQIESTSSLKSRSSLENKSSLETKKSPLETKRSSFEIGRFDFEIRRSAFEIKRSPSETKRSPSETKRSPLDIKRSPLDIKKSSLDIKKSLDIKRSPLDTKKSTLDTKISSLETKKSSLESKRSPLDTNRCLSDTKISQLDPKGLSLDPQRSVHTKRPSLETRKSGLDTNTSHLDTKKCLLDTKRFLLDHKRSLEIKKLGLEAKKATINTERCFLNSKIASLDTRSPLETKRSSLETKRFSLETKKSPLETNKSALETKKSSLETKKSTLETKKSSLDTQKSSIDTKRSYDIKRSSLDTVRSPLDTERSPLDIEGSSLDTESSSLEAKKYLLDTQSFSLEDKRRYLSSGSQGVASNKYEGSKQELVSKTLGGSVKQRKIDEFVKSSVHKTQPMRRSSSQICLDKTQQVLTPTSAEMPKKKVDKSNVLLAKAGSSQNKGEGGQNRAKDERKDGRNGVPVQTGKYVVKSSNLPTTSRAEFINLHALSRTKSESQITRRSKERVVQRIKSIAPDGASNRRVQVYEKLIYDNNQGYTRTEIMIGSKSISQIGPRCRKKSRSLLERNDSEHSGKSDEDITDCDNIRRKGVLVVQKRNIDSKGESSNMEGDKWEGSGDYNDHQKRMESKEDGLSPRGKDDNLEQNNVSLQETNEGFKEKCSDSKEKDSGQHEMNDCLKEKNNSLKESGFSLKECGYNLKESRHTSKESGDTPGEGGDTPDEGGDTSDEGGDPTNEGNDTSNEGGDALKESSHTLNEDGDTPKECGDTLKENSDSPTEFGDTANESSDVPKERSDAQKERSDIPKETSDVPKEGGDTLKESSDTSKESGSVREQIGDASKQSSYTSKESDSVLKRSDDDLKERGAPPKEFGGGPNVFGSLPNEFGNPPGQIGCYPNELRSFPNEDHIILKDDIQKFGNPKELSYIPNPEYFQSIRLDQSESNRHKPVYENLKKVLSRSRSIENHGKVEKTRLYKKYGQKNKKVSTHGLKHKKMGNEAAEDKTLERIISDLIGDLDDARVYQLDVDEDLGEKWDSAYYSGNGIIHKLDDEEEIGYVLVLEEEYVEEQPDTVFEEDWRTKKLPKLTLETSSNDQATSINPTILETSNSTSVTPPYSSFLYNSLSRGNPNSIISGSVQTGMDLMDLPRSKSSPDFPSSTVKPGFSSFPKKHPPPLKFDFLSPLNFEFPSSPKSVNSLKTGTSSPELAICPPKAGICFSKDHTPSTKPVTSSPRPGMTSPTPSIPPKPDTPIKSGISSPKPGIHSPKPDIPSPKPGTRPNPGSSDLEPGILPKPGIPPNSGTSSPRPETPQRPNSPSFSKLDSSFPRPDLLSSLPIKPIPLSTSNDQTSIDPQWNASSEVLNFGFDDTNSTVVEAPNYRLIIEDIDDSNEEVTRKTSEEMKKYRISRIWLDNNKNPVIRTESIANNLNDLNKNMVQPNQEDNEESIEEQHSLESEEVPEKKMTKKIRLIMQEILETEKNYMHKLRMIISEYLPEMMDDDFPVGLIGRETVIFGNIEELYAELNDNFYPNLKKCNGINDIAELFLKQRRLFELYIQYNRNNVKSQKELALYGDFFEKKQKELEDPFNLSSHLLQPTQRLCRYVLLLKRLAKECQEEECPCPLLEKAIRFVDSEISRGNDIVALDQVKGAKINIYEQGPVILRNSFRIWTSSRKNTYEAMVFLMTKCVLITNIQMKNNEEIYQFVDAIEIHDLGYTHLENSNEFKIWFRKMDMKVYTLKTEKEDVKKEWCKVIHEELWKQLMESKDRMKNCPPKRVNDVENVKAKSQYVERPRKESGIIHSSSFKPRKPSTTWHI